MMHSIDLLPENLFLSSGFSDFCIGLAQGQKWLYTQQGDSPITHCLFQALQVCTSRIHWESIKIFLLNGPGSTMGIRAFCSFIRTALALGKINIDQVYSCDTLHAVSYALEQQHIQRPVCARINLMERLCVRHSRDELHTPSESELQQALWLPHPCLPKELPVVQLSFDAMLPLLTADFLWHTTGAPDVFLHPAKHDGQ